VDLNRRPGDRTHRRARWCAVAALATGIVLGGCGKQEVNAGRNEAQSSTGAVTHATSGGPSRAPGSTQPGRSGGLNVSGAAAVLGAAADKTANQKSATFTVTLNQVTAAGEMTVATGKGEYDSSRSHVQLSTGAGATPGGDLGGLGDLGDLGDLGGLGGLLGGPSELITDGTTIYIKSPALGGALGGGGNTSWIAFTQSDDASTGFGGGSAGLGPLGGAVSPQSFLDSLHQAGNVTEVGSENVAGVHTTHYRADIDSTQTTEPGVSKFGGQQYVEEVWIDDDGVVRRVSYMVDASKAGGAAGAGLSGKLHVTYDLSNIGQPVTINVPPPDQVTSGGDVSQLGGLGAGGLPGG
jgi:hypothetical protein